MVSRLLARPSLTVFLASGLMLPAMRATALSPDPPVDPGIAAERPAVHGEEELYSRGNQAMNEQRWPDAVTLFNQLAALHGRRADAALYWKAYSLAKVSRKTEANAVCDQLRVQTPDSSWNRECLVLEVRGSVDAKAIAELARTSALVSVNGVRWQGGTERPERPERPERMERSSTDPNADIRMLALNSLLQQDPAKAVPILRETLNSASVSDSSKRHALFVLSRSKAPEAQAMLGDIAAGRLQPSLQGDAIRMLAISRGKQGNGVLVDGYRASTDPRVKKAIISALFITQDAPRLVELARGEKDLNLKREIVAQLSLMRDPAATDYMLELLR